MFLATTSLNPISLAPLLETLTGLTTYPKPTIYRVKLESGLVTEDDMLWMGHCQVLPPLFPLQMGTVVVDSQQELPCLSIGPVTTGQGPVVDGFTASLHSIQIPHLLRQGPITYEDHPEQSTGLARCGLLMSPSGLAWHQSSSGNMPPEDAVDGSTNQTHATSNSTLPHGLTEKCKRFMPNNQ